MLSGSLVVYAKDVRQVCASNLYVVLGKARPDKHGRRQLKIHSITTMGGTSNTWAPKTRKPMNALVSDLTPISAWGMAIENVTSILLANGQTIHKLNLAREIIYVFDATGLRKWGQLVGATWDWMLTGEIRKTEHAELIKKRMIADYLGQVEEAA